MNTLDMALDDVIKTKGSKGGRGAPAKRPAPQKTVAAKTPAPAAAAASADTASKPGAGLRGRLKFAKGTMKTALGTIQKAAAAAAKATANPTVTTTEAGAKRRAMGGAPPAAPAAKVSKFAGGSIKNTETKLGMTLEDMIKGELKTRDGGGKKADPKARAKSKAEPKGRAKAKAGAAGARRNIRGGVKQQQGGMQWGTMGRSMKKRAAMASESAWEQTGSRRMRSDAPERNSFGWTQSRGSGGKGGGRDAGWGSGRSGPSGRWSAGGDDWGGNFNSGRLSGRSGGGGGGGGAGDAGGWGRSWGGGGAGGGRDRAEPYWSAPVNGSSRASHTSGGGRSERSSGCQIKVTNVPKNLDTRDIKEAFEDNGRVTSCQVERGIAWVTFERAIDAKKAMQTFDRGELNGQTIFVTAA